MSVTDKSLEPEIIRPAWQTMPRGAKMRDLSALDIMVDVDEVIVPTVDTVHRIAHERGLHDNSTPHNTWRGWELYGCSEEDYWACWSELATGGHYLTLEPIPGAREALLRAYWEGHRIHLVTARGFMAHAEDIRRWTKEWVEEFGIPHHSLCFARKKVDIQRDLGVRFDYAFDDSPRNVAALREDGVMTYLVSHPHNETEDDPHRVDSLAEGVDLILKEHS